MQQHEYRFGTFTIDAGRGVVLRNGKETNLRRQSFDVLMHLVERPGILVTKDELVAEIWGNTAVTDNSLTQCLAEIRKALGDEEHRIVRTVVRRGYLFEPPPLVSPSGSAGRAAPVSRRITRVSAVVVVGLATLAAVAAYLRTDDVQSTIDNPVALLRVEPTTEKPAVALMRFDNLSGDEEDQPFIDGIREEIATQLGGINGLRVVSLLSVDRVSDTAIPMQNLSKELGADYVMRGSVHRAQDTLRLNVQLFDARADAQVWAETNDVELTVDSLLDVENEVAVAVASKLGMQMLPDYYLLMSAKGPANIAALDLFYNGLFYVRQIERDGVGPDAMNVHLAIGRLEEAIAADGNWAPPHFAVARTMRYWASTARRGSKEYAERLDVAKKYVERAIEIDDRYAPAWSVLAYTQIMRDRDFRAARYSYGRIAALGVRESSWLHAYLLMHEARFDEAIIQYRHTIENVGDLFGARAKQELVAAYLCAGRYREAIDFINEFRKSMPELPLSVRQAEARLHLKLGERDKGLALAEAIAAEYGDDLPVAGLFALAGMPERSRQALQEIDDPTEQELEYMFDAALDLGEYDLALDYLEASIPTFDPLWRVVHCDGRTDALADNQRFMRINREIGIPE